MSERPGKSRPMPAAPYDDPSIPVLTERLTLPELDLDITLPAFGDTAPAPTPEPVVPAPAPANATPAPPAVHDGSYDADTWLVETIPMAPAPLDPLSFDLPIFDLPPLPPAVGEAMHSQSPGAGLAVHGPAVAPASAPTASEPGFSPVEVAIPTSLMRPVPTATPAADQGSLPALSEVAPKFDRLPVRTADEVLPPLVASAPASAAFTVAPASALPDEAQLRESILKALSERLPQEVESILRRQLAPAVDAAIDAAAAQLAADIRRAAAHSLRELVDQAVKAELARLHDSGLH